jgi:hypothetical protein
MHPGLLPRLVGVSQNPISGQLPSRRQPKGYLRGGWVFSGEAGSKLPDIANALRSSLSLACELRGQSLRPSSTDGTR